MIGGKRKRYPYYMDDNLLGRRRGRSRTSAFLKVILFLALLGGGAYLLVTQTAFADRLISLLPIPRELKSVRLLHNGQEVTLAPGSQLVLNPKDSLQVVEADTDGWIGWGTRLDSPDTDISALREKPLEIKSLWPEETLEQPRPLDIQAFWWDKPLGKVSLLVQLDARDWLQKANATGEPEQKIAYLRKVLEMTPDNILAKTQLAGILFDTRKYGDAALLYEDIIKAGKTAPLLERLLVSYQKTHRVDDALGVYLELLDMSRDSEQFKQFLAYLDQSKSDADTVKYLTGNRQKIPAAFHSALDLFVANLYTQMKDWSSAAANYEKAVKSGVKDPDILYNLAVSYQQSDNPDQAIQALERYLQKSPGDMKTWMQLASLQEKKGALAQARATYETILQKNPRHEEALVRLVALLEKAKDKQALESAYEKLAQLQPKNKVVHFNLGMLYYEGQKWDKAADAFKAVAALDSKDIESRKVLLDTYRKAKNRDGEVEMLQALVKLESDNEDYYKSLFSIYDSRKEYNTLAPMLRTAVEQHPNSVALHQYLLYTYLKLDDKKAAVKELDQLIHLDPKEKKYLRQAANLHETLGQYPEALKKLEKLIKLAPKDKEAKDDYMRIRMRVLEDNKKKAT